MSRTISKQLLNQLMAKTGLQDDEIQTWLDILHDLGPEKTEELRQWLHVRNTVESIIRSQPFFK